MDKAVTDCTRIIDLFSEHFPETLSLLSGIIDSATNIEIAEFLFLNGQGTLRILYDRHRQRFLWYLFPFHRFMNKARRNTSGLVSFIRNRHLGRRLFYHVSFFGQQLFHQCLVEHIGHGIGRSFGVGE